MRNKQKAFLKEENLLTLLSQNNFIIPEIQREYVWGNNEKVILKFLEELKIKIGEGCKCCNLPNGNTRINIGFLYSYKPEYVKVQNDRFLDENLIDGQQRFTTLFLLLFYFALKEDRKRDFLSLIRFDDFSMSFDFKVRDLTKKFLLEFVKKTNNLLDVQNVKAKTWFLKDYKTDVSISAMMKTLDYIQQVFNDDTKYFNHILNNVVFWHFKTEVTSEGEELYITMNARGEDLADNEITKAALMLQGEDLVHSGEKWEEWQDFFWKNRDRQRSVQSADFGFNSFIMCIAGLENYIRLNGDDFSFMTVEELLTLEKVEHYISTFKYLVQNADNFKQQYNYADWVDKCLAEIWSIFNDNQTNWSADYTDQNKGTEQNRMIFIWSWLLYLKDKELKDIDNTECFRILRFFYVRYKNFNRAVSSLRQTVGIIDINGVFDITGQLQDSSDSEEEYKANNSYRTQNERLKYQFLYRLKTFNDNDLLNYESVIWEIEDHPFNLEGYGFKNINSSHIINFESQPTLEDLYQIKARFYKLFPVDNNKVNLENANTIRNLLLWYGAYWQKKWASYYWKYDFGDWKRIVRDMDTENLVFNSFFNDFKDRKSLLELVSEITKEPEYKTNTDDELEAFKWYAYKLKNNMWKQGRYIAINHYNHPEMDKYFPSFREMVNIKGNFNGGTPQVLSHLVKE